MEKILNNDFTKGFKKFINKGNIFHLSIAFIISQSFAKIVKSLSNDIIMPLINFFINENANFNNLKIHLTKDIFINYGIFFQTIFEFLFVSFFIYVICTIIFRKNINKDKTSIENLTQEQIKLLKEIKNILETNNKNIPNNK